MIIAIEGTDGSGKKTQSEWLYNYLIEKGNVKKMSFPNYDSRSSEPVKMYLGGELVEHANDFDPYQTSALFAVDRLCTMHQFKPFLDNNGVLLLDRYVYSNMIHQGGKITDKIERKKYFDWLYHFEFDELKLPKADIVIFLDMPTECSMQLAAERTEYKTGEKKDIHESDKNHIINAYECAKNCALSYNWQIINCVDNDRIKSPAEIHKEVVQIVEKWV